MDVALENLVMPENKGLMTIPGCSRLGPVLEKLKQREEAEAGDTKLRSAFEMGQGGKGTLEKRAKCSPNLNCSRMVGNRTPAVSLDKFWLKHQTKTMIQLKTVLPFYCLYNAASRV